MLHSFLHGGGSGVRLYDGTDLKLVGAGALSYRGSTGDSLLLQILSGVVLLPRDLQLPGNTLHLSSPCL